MMDEAEEIARNAAGIFLGVTSFRALSGYLLWRAYAIHHAMQHATVSRDLRI